MRDDVKGDIVAGAGLVAGGALEGSGAKIKHRYEVECWRKGERVWVEHFENLVTNAGKTKYLDATLKTGLAAPSWFVGLITGPGASNTYAAADTMASHVGWAENTAYSNTTRPAWTPGTITNSAGTSSVDNSAARASFNINGTATVAGAFLVDNSAIGGATGTLVSEGSFSTGDRAAQW
jgi:hypothetical protein